MSAAASNIREDIRQQVNDCLRRGDKARLGVMRIISSEIGKAEIAKQGPISEPEFIQLLNRLRKQHQASMEQFKAAGRDDLYQREAAELSIVEELLPQQLGADELKQIIAQGIAASGADSPKDIGRVMAAVKQQLLGKADMGEVSRLIKEKLGG